MHDFDFPLERVHCRRLAKYSPQIGAVAARESWRERVFGRQPGIEEVNETLTC